MRGGLTFSRGQRGAVLRFAALGPDRLHYEFHSSLQIAGSSFEKGSAAGEGQNLGRAKACKAVFSGVL